MTKKTTLIGILAVALLLVGILAVYVPQMPAWLGGQSMLAADAGKITYVSDLDFWQRTPRERIVSANAYFDLAHDLNNVPMQVGNWVGENAPEDNKEVMILLDPEQYVQRLYHDEQGHYVYLTMVGGRSSQPFHAPDICYDADGWQYDLGSHPTKLPNGGDVYGLYLDATKHVAGEAEPWQHVVYYFYLFPKETREQSDGIVLFKLTTAKYGSVEDTLAILENFTSQFFSTAKVRNAAPAGNL